MMNKNRSVVIFLAPLFTAILSLTLFMVAVERGWMGPPQGVGNDFCEVSDGLIKQPANTWSNLGFVTAGLVMAWLMWKGAFAENKNAFTQTTFTPIFFSSLVILLGPCSMAMHATLTHIGGAFDLLSMFLISAFLMAYALQRFFGWKPLYFTVVFVLVVAASEWAGSYPHQLGLISGRTAFAFFISVAAAFELLNFFVRKLHHEIKWIVYGQVSFGLALVFWNLGKTNAGFCDPHSLLQGHAAWHLLDALSLFFFFRFYVSERFVGGRSPLPLRDRRDSVAAG
jgi:Ceramidase